MKIAKEEFMKRLNAVREFAKDEELGGVAVFSVPWGHLWHQTGHIGYLSNWASRDRNVNSMIVIPNQGKPVLLYAGLPYLEDVLASVTAISDIRIVAPEDPRAAALPEGETTFGKETEKILAEHGMAGKKLGVVGAEHMPLSVWRSLKRYFSEERLVLCRDIVAEMRCRKTDAEIGFLKKAAEFADIGYETLLKTAKVGKRGYEVVAEMERAVRLRGADFVKFWFISGPAEGWTDTWPIVRPHERVLEDGDQIISGAYTVYKGYWAHGMRAGRLGKPSAQQEMYAPVCSAIIDAAAAKLAPGVLVSDVVKAAIEKARSLDYRLSSHRIGHGIGLDYSEMPFMSEKNEQCLEAGMVAVIHPQIELPDTKSFIVPFGDMYHITEAGTQRLMKFPLEPFSI